MKDLSVIIPIYNTPIDALERCLQSVQSLGTADYEVLLIDDGSEESVGVFCREYISRRTQFRYIYKENGGVSSARNMGIEEAKGRYITFVDADDVLIGAPLQKALTRDDAPDIIIFDMILTQRGADSVWYAFDLPDGAVNREQVLYQLLTASSISGPVAKLYKAQLLRQTEILFDTGFVAGEDWMFVVAYVVQAESFYYCKELSYRYFRDGATGHCRAVRFPDQMLDNQLARYAKKQEVLAMESWKEYSVEKIRYLAAIELTENLFNIATDMLLAGLYTKDRKRRICKAIRQAGVFLNAGTPKKTRLKKWTITQFPPALYLLAMLRRIYLKRKG